MDKLFLDANILFSAAYSKQAGVGQLWKIKDAILVTSSYAVEEARRNLSTEQREALDKLLKKVKIFDFSALNRPINEAQDLNQKDKPILLAAIAVKATHLITGDFRHFSPYYGKTIEGVLIVPPSKYLNQKPAKKKTRSASADE